jgi:hypothetical protein
MVAGLASPSAAAREGHETLQGRMAARSSAQHHGRVLVTASSAGQESLATLLGEWVAGLSERERAVFEHRIARTDQTLAEVGRAHGRSRERIRQVQRKLVAEMSSWLSAAPAASKVATLRARLEQACPGLTLWAELTRSVPELAERLPGTDVHLVDLAAFLVPDLCRDGDWAGWQPIAHARRRTADVATLSAPVGDRLTRLAVLQHELSLDGRQWAAWVSSCGLRDFRGWVVRSKATVPELAEAVLAMQGQPMTTAQIAGQVGVKIWQLRDRCLGRDKRFRRTAPGVLGLAEWNLPTYRSIREEITTEILAAGGQAKVDDVAASLAKRFGVSPTSVEHYARGPEFSRHRGVIELADGRHSG